MPIRYLSKETGHFKCPVLRRLIPLSGKEFGTRSPDRTYNALYFNGLAMSGDWKLACAFLAMSNERNAHTSGYARGRLD